MKPWVSYCPCVKGSGLRIVHNTQLILSCYPILTLNEQGLLEVLILGGWWLEVILHQVQVHISWPSTLIKLLTHYLLFIFSLLLILHHRKRLLCDLVPSVVSGIRMQRSWILGFTSQSSNKKHYEKRKIVCI